MRRQGPLTIRHLAVTALVVVIVLAQLCWWTLFTLRESTARLDLERQRLLTTCQLLADQVATTLRTAENELRLEVLRDAGTRQPNTTHLVKIHEVRHPEDDTGWQLHNGAAVLTVCRSDCLVGRLLPIGEWLETPPGIVLTTVPDLAIGVSLPAPYGELIAQPTRASWQAPLTKHHRRLRMFLSEGTFFVVLVLILVLLLWKTVRRDRELDSQHRNFISAITHELKSPLAAMRISMETVMKGRADSETAQRFLENALHDIERLESLVQKVLEVTRYGLGDASLRLSRGDLSEVVNAVAETFSRRATATGVQLAASVQDGIAARVDEEAFAIVVSNLLENAIKYGGKQPEVGLSLRLHEQTVVLEVRDNGRGIADDDLPFIFDRFFRAEDEMTRTTRGTGLGLYLVRQIVSAHGGSVEVGATGPDGTTMRVLLPEAGMMEEEP